MAETVSILEFQSRLRVWCKEGRSYDQLPSKRRDRWILYYTIVRSIGEEEILDEPGINDRIRDWLVGIGRNLQIDPVTLRRELIDGGFLQRDPAGRVYRKSTRYLRTFDFEEGMVNLDFDAALNPDTT